MTQERDGESVQLNMHVRIDSGREDFELRDFEARLPKPGSPGPHQNHQNHQ